MNTSARYDRHASARSSSPANASIPTPITGRVRCCRSPVIDHWWQTETGWPVAANCVGLGAFPVKPGSPTKPVPGYVVEILDDDGNVLPPNKEGAVVIRLPLPPGTLPTLWRDDARYIETYLAKYPGYYLTGDGGYIDEDGYLFIMGRVDDIIIVAGHNLSTGLDGAGAGEPSRRGRVCGDRRARPTEDAAATRLRRCSSPASTRASRADRATSWCSWCARRWGRWRTSGRRWWWRACPRPAPARCCGRRCARSPTVMRGRCRPRSTIRRRSTRSRPRCRLRVFARAPGTPIGG